MNMFCFQCQETVRNQGCTLRGVCGKDGDTANLQDLLIYLVRGIAVYAHNFYNIGFHKPEIARFIIKSLFATITNANFDEIEFLERIQQAFKIRDSLQKEFLKMYEAEKGQPFSDSLPDEATWFSDKEDEIYQKAQEVGILQDENEDIRSLKWFMIYGLKGISAYAEHASVLGFEEEDIFSFIYQSLAFTTEEHTLDEYFEMLMKTCEYAVKTMALLDKANTSTFGKPEITTVQLGVRKNSGILVSGHDLKDFEEILEQTKGTGVGVYTHGEMLPAHYYPAFKKYDHFVGNYGSAWWQQNSDFENFNGPIIMTTNCIIPVKDAYRDRIFTTGVVGYPGLKHIPEREQGKTKDFSEIIELAKKCDPPKEIETGEIVGGFAHDQVLALADKIIDAVKSGAIKRFIVMAGCDGRFKTREYYTKVAQKLPKDAVILTAGCAKYRYNKLELGDINGIPRVLDAGQCNDSYSLALVALKLKEVFGVGSVNDLPISFDVAWYEQKAVAVLLALLSLGFKGMRIGTTFPAFVSENVGKVLVEKFDLKHITEPAKDIEAMMIGQ